MTAGRSELHAHAFASFSITPGPLAHRVISGAASSNASAEKNAHRRCRSSAWNVGRASSRRTFPSRARGTTT
jgi:hypothetical protein